jgi:hypothetical protein
MEHGMVFGEIHHNSLIACGIDNVDFKIVLSLG